MKKIIITWIKILIIINIAQAQIERSSGVTNQTPRIPQQQNTTSNQQNYQSQNQNQQPITIKQKEKPKKTNYNLKHSFLKKNQIYQSKTFNYQRGEIYTINITLLLDTVIVLPANDNILNYRLNASKFFQVNILKQQNIPTNKLYVNSLASGVSTNLTIITQNDNIYQFILISKKITERTPPDLIVYIKNNDDINTLQSLQIDNKFNTKEENFSKYPSKIYTIKELKAGIRPDSYQTNDYLNIIDRLEPEDLNKINLIETQYTIATNNKIDNPLLIFDDGRWTYFKFTETNSLQGIKIPTISIIENNIESPTNPHILKNYIVIKTTAKQFILRRNKEFTCVFRRKNPELLK